MVFLRRYTSIAILLTLCVSSAYAACDRGTPTVAMTLMPRQDGFVDATVSWTFPYPPDTSSHLIRFFLNGEPAGIWYYLPQSGTRNITFDMRCKFPPNQQVTATIEVPGGCTATATQSAGFVPRPTAGAIDAEIDSDGYLHATMPFTFPFQAGGDYSTRYAVSSIVGPDGVVREETNHYSLPTEGILTFTRNAVCWPRGTYQVRVQLRGCEWVNQVASVAIEPEATGSVTVSDVGGTAKHAAIDYHFEGTPDNANGYRSIVVGIFDALGNKRVEQTHTAFTRAGTLGIDFDTSCWPEGDVRVAADLQQCSMPPRRVEGATKIQRAADVALSKLPASPTGDLQALVNYHFGQPNGRVTTTLLEWRAANGVLHPGRILDDRSLTNGSGSFTVTFTPPSESQQAHVMVTVNGCSTSSDDAWIECATCDQASSRNPVYYTDGNMLLSDVDPLPPIAGFGLARTYNSNEQVIALFGRGWTTLFDRRLVADSSGGVSIVSPTNEVVTFRSVNSEWRQVWPSARPPYGVLQFNAAAGTYSYRAGESQELAIFEASSGHLLAIRDLATGREAQISYDVNGLPNTLTDNWTGVSWRLTIVQRRVSAVAVAGRPDLTWTYQYDNSGNLVSVFAPGGAVWRTYEYSANRMIASRDVLNNLIESHAFDVYGWALDSTGSIDEIASIEYNITGSTIYEKVTRVTFKTGAVAEYTLRPSGSAWRVVQITGGCASCGVSDTTFVRDEDGRIVREQTADGYVTVRVYASDRLKSEERFLHVPGCNPQTDANQCRLGPDALAVAALEPTAATVKVTYEHGDSNWPDRVTVVQTPSIYFPGGTRRVVETLHPQHAVPLASTTWGWTGVNPIEEQHVIAREYYGDVPPCDAQGNGCTPVDAFIPRFDPGGDFRSSWLALPQPTGLVRSIDGQRVDLSDLTLYVYYPIDETVPPQLRGRLAALKNAAGHIARMADYDVFGNATRVIDLNGVVTEKTYDSLGRLLTSKIKAIPTCDTSVDALCATDLTTTRIYAGVTGSLQSEQTPTGGVSVYAYDGRGRVASISRGPSAADLRERLETTYDGLTGKKSMERRLALEGGTWVEKMRESFSYDIEARLQIVTHGDGSAVHFAHDAADRIVSVRDENHSSPNTFYSYDAAGRLTSVTQSVASAPNGSIVSRYGYDTQGNTTSVTDPNSNVTTYTFDDFGQMLTQSSPVTGTTKYTYDLAGDLLTLTDANGATITRVYDALSRPTSAISSRSGLPSEIVQWQYDDPEVGRYGLGRLTQMTDPTGLTKYYFQRGGQLRREERQFSGLTSSYVTAYRYDANGNRSAMTYPSGMTVSYGYDFADRPVSASATATGGAMAVISAANYLPFGPTTSLTFGNGTTQTMIYDARYRITQNKLAAGAATLAQYSYVYDPAGNIIQINDGQDAAYNRTFAYDDLNRLVTATTGANLWLAASYAYDAMGNILSTKIGEIVRPPEPGDQLRQLTPHVDSSTLPLGRVTSFAYVGSTPKIATVTSNDLERPVTYDAAGNETSYVVQRSYSPRNYLASIVEDMEGTVHRINYGYDGRGVRVRRTEPSVGGGDASRYFIYSPELRLLAVTADDAPNPWVRGPRVNVTATAPSLQTEIVWFGGRPVMQGTPGIGASFTFSDHLATPIIQTSATNPSIVWRAEYEPFGNIYEMRVGNRVDQPLRFPGQEVAMTLEGQEENYNVYRWYRTGWSRYTQGDPIGLNGGNHLYGYAGAQPINASDPWGLYYYRNEVVITHDAVGGSYTILPTKLNVTYSCGCDIKRRGMRLVFDIRFQTPVHISVWKPKGSWQYYCDLICEFNHVGILDYWIRQSADMVVPYESQIYPTEGECQAAGRQAYQAMQDAVSGANGIMHFLAQAFEEFRHNSYNPCPFIGTP